MFSKRMILCLVLSVFVGALGLASCHKAADDEEETPRRRAARLIKRPATKAALAA